MDDRGGAGQVTPAAFNDVVPADRAPGVVLVLGVLGVLVGLAVRAWLFAHQPLTGDEAIVALIAREIRRGHLDTFYWGQAYGGGEPYLVAIMTSLFGSGPIAINISATMLTGLSAILVGSVVGEVLPAASRWLATVAGVLFWLWPEALVWNSTRELGFRCVTMLAGIASLKLGFRWARTCSWESAVGLGLALGVGWWSSPEIVYFCIPVVFVLVGALRRKRLDGLTTLIALVSPVVAGGAVGAIPWIITNIRSGFSSLSSRASPVYSPSTYGQRLEIAVGRTVPMMFGLRSAPGGGWVAGATGKVFYAVVLAAVLSACLHAIFRIRAGLPLAAVAVGCLAFPFVNAVFPATTYWDEGIYGVFLVPLVIITVIGALGSWTAGRLRADDRSAVQYLCALMMAVAMSSTTVAFSDAWLQTPPLYSNQIEDGSILAGWNPNPSSTAARIAQMARAVGIHYAYADYWTAYVLDVLGDGNLAVTDPRNDRWVAEYRKVRAARDPAWLFVSPTEVTAAQHTFPRTRVGPDNMSENDFIATLTTRGIAYKVYPLGVLDAIVPASRVTPTMVGLPGPEHR